MMKISKGENKMNDKINQDEINAVAWKACDTFRGVVDPSEYKNYILVFLFLKYLSDTWNDKIEPTGIELTGGREPYSLSPFTRSSRRGFTTLFMALRGNSSTKK